MVTAIDFLGRIGFRKNRPKVTDGPGDFTLTPVATLLTFFLVQANIPFRDAEAKCGPACKKDKCEI